LLTYRGRKLEKTYTPDFICFESIIVEIADEHRSQILNYVNAANFKLGLLINFGHYPKLEYERFALTMKNGET